MSTSSVSKDFVFCGYNCGVLNQESLEKYGLLIENNYVKCNKCGWRCYMWLSLNHILFMHIINKRESVYNKKAYTYSYQKYMRAKRHVNVTEN